MHRRRSERNISRHERRGSVYLPERRLDAVCPVPGCGYAIFRMRKKASMMSQIIQASPEKKLLASRGDR